MSLRTDGATASTHSFHTSQIKSVKHRSGIEPLALQIIKSLPDDPTEAQKDSFTNMLFFLQRTFIRCIKSLSKNDQPLAEKRILTLGNSGSGVSTVTAILLNALVTVDESSFEVTISKRDESQRLPKIRANNLTTTRTGPSYFPTSTHAFIDAPGKAGHVAQAQNICKLVALKIFTQNIRPTHLILLFSRIHFEDKSDFGNWISGLNKIIELKKNHLHSLFVCNDENLISDMALSRKPKNAAGVFRDEITKEQTGVRKNQLEEFATICDSIKIGENLLNHDIVNSESFKTQALNWIDKTPGMPDFKMQNISSHPGFNEFKETLVICAKYFTDLNKQDQEVLNILPGFDLLIKDIIQLFMTLEEAQALDEAEKSVLKAYLESAIPA